MTLLDVRAVDVYYGAVQAVRGVSLGVDQGEMVALLGANGAGKTTTLRTISGLLRPVSGEIWFDGARIDGMPAHRVVHRGLSHVPEGRDLFPELTVRENLQLGFWSCRHSAGGFGGGAAGPRTRRWILGQRRTPRADGGLAHAMQRVLDVFPRLSDRVGQAAGTLSGGEQQMLGIGRALMGAPKLLVVDELSLGLAPQVVETLFEVLTEVNRTGTAVLIVEQFVEAALAHTNRAYVLAKGEVVLQGPSSELARSEELIASYVGSAMK